ncbi:MAG TPA: DUF3949 domain-containing protein [Anoxybacillus sp.]|jgi:hypothetical protein|nr:DUF3949 domain-containing protein [Anoxybacillus sp.]
MGLVIGLIVAVVLLVTIMMTPIQYRYIEGLEEVKQKKKVTQQKMYDDMSATEQMLHEHAQSNLFLILPNTIAYIIYKYKHRKNK